MKDKVIIIDSDGVLLDWSWGFTTWAFNTHPKLQRLYPSEYKVNAQYNITKEYGKRLTKEFNSSSDIGFLHPLRDSVKYINKLADDGYRFHVLSSFSLSPTAHKLRIQNLQRLFGDVFDEYTFLNTGEDKDEALAELAIKYNNENLYWIEDKAANADAGELVGFDPILIAHDSNVDYKGKRFFYFKEVYEYITKNKFRIGEY